jgi:hypothetical protein
MLRDCSSWKRVVIVGTPVGRIFSNGSANQDQVTCRFEKPVK